MIVVDASAAVLGLSNDGAARRLMATEALAAPHLVDAEIAQALRRQVARDLVPTADALAALRVWASLGVIRYPVTGMLERIWTLRDNVSAYDACYVALAEALECALLSGDARLGAAPGPACPITLVRT